MNKQLEQFIKLVPELEPIEFLGLSKILCVELVDENGKAKDFSEILLEMIDKFCGAKSKPRKDILKLMKQSTKVKDNGNGTEN